MMPFLMAICVIIYPMIKSFADNETQKIYLREWSRILPSDIQERARIKLLILNVAKSLNDLRNPPANHLERLTRDRDGQYSIRVNKQWRICFVWKNGNAYNVTIVDYH